MQKKRRGLKKYTSNVEIPVYIKTLHKLADYLFKEFVRKDGYNVTEQVKFFYLVKVSNDYSTGLYRSAQLIAGMVYDKYIIKMCTKDKQQFKFIITKHLEELISKAKNQQ